MTPPLVFEFMTKSLVSKGFYFARVGIREITLTGFRVTPLQRSLVKDV